MCSLDLELDTVVVVLLVYAFVSISVSIAVSVSVWVWVWVLAARSWVSGLGSWGRSLARYVSSSSSHVQLLALVAFN